MSGQMNEEQIYEEARQRVKAKRDFYEHLSAWVIISVILFIIWALNGFDRSFWFLWPVCIWGIFVLIHCLKVFVIMQRLDRHAIEKEVEKIKKEQE